MIGELSPFDVSSGLWGLERFAKELELSSTQHDLAHVECDSELSLSDESSSELVKISEELADSDSLLFAELSHLGDDVHNIIRLVPFDVNTSDSWSSLWVVVEGVVVSSSNREELFR